MVIHLLKRRMVLGMMFVVRYYYFCFLLYFVILVCFGWIYVIIFSFEDYLIIALALKTPWISRPKCWKTCLPKKEKKKSVFPNHLKKGVCFSGSFEKSMRPFKKKAVLQMNNLFYYKCAYLIICEWNNLKLIVQK